MEKKIWQPCTIKKVNWPRQWSPSWISMFQAKLLANERLCQKKRLQLQLRLDRALLPILQHWRTHRSSRSRSQSFASDTALVLPLTFMLLELRRPFTKSLWRSFFLTKILFCSKWIFTDNTVYRPLPLQTVHACNNNNIINMTLFA